HTEARESCHQVPRAKARGEVVRPRADASLDGGVRESREEEGKLLGEVIAAQGVAGATRENLAGPTYRAPRLEGADRSRANSRFGIGCDLRYWLFLRDRF